MEKISEAILDKVKTDAQQVIKEAEEKAWQEIEKAEKQKEIKFEEEKQKIREEVEQEAARILAQASIKARQGLSKAKADVIDEIVSQVKDGLLKASTDESSLLNLVKEAVTELGADRVRLYAAPKDMGTVQKLIKGDRELAGKIIETRELNFSGGVIAESANGKTSIDNTYDTRLEMLLPQILPEIGQELFKEL
ncbi:V-type ATP synthase subunit E [Chloroflexota bacterium]